MPSKILARGAEAILTKTGSKVIKNRIKKSYRFPELDIKLRKQRTKSEAKLLTKANKIISTPNVITDNKSTSGTDKLEQTQGYKISMDYISGKKLSEHLDKLKNYRTICKQIGKNIAKLHDAGIIHGDLTTSNIIYVSLSKSHNKSTQKDINNINNKFRSDSKQRTIVYFIDFGLGFHSNRIEDKAVDLYLIKQALEAKHSKIYENAFTSVLRGYKISKNFSKTIERLEKVEKRGRYKERY
jgi:bifunctional N6-L-threonylcarbamoyladenine synthase / protein kinase Bud32